MVAAGGLQAGGGGGGGGPPAVNPPARGEGAGDDENQENVAEAPAANAAARVIAPVQFVCANNGCNRTRATFTFANPDANRWANPDQPMLSPNVSMLNVAEMSDRLSTALTRINTYRSNAIDWLDEWEAAISAHILVEPVKKTLDGYVLVWSTEARKVIEGAKKTVLAWYENMLAETTAISRLVARYDSSYTRLMPYTNNVYDAAQYDPVAQAIKYTKSVRTVVKSTNRIVASDHTIRARWTALSKRLELASQGQLTDQLGKPMLNFIQVHHSLLSLLPNTGPLMTAQTIIADRINANTMTAQVTTGDLNDLPDVGNPVDTLTVLTDHVNNMVASMMAFTLYTPNKYNQVAQIRASLDALPPVVRDPLNEMLTEYVEQHSPEVYLATTALGVNSRNRLDIQAAKQSLMGKLSNLDEESDVYRTRLQELLDLAVRRLVDLAAL